LHCSAGLAGLAGLAGSGALDRAMQDIRADAPAPGAGVTTSRLGHDPR
jgi:hypothetical protein